MWCRRRTVEVMSVLSFSSGYLSDACHLASVSQIKSVVFVMIPS
jgi:hypothetical protein